MAGLTAASGLAAPVGAVHAQAACYTDSQFPDERFVIDAKTQGVLINSWYDLVELLFGGKQTAYSVHGKWAFAHHAEGSPWFVEMAAATGTIDVGSKYLGKNANPTATHTQTGAHLGLTVHLVRGAHGEASSVPFTIDCGSDEASVLPHQWTCESYTEWGNYLGVSTLSKVSYQTDDERCNLFEAVPAPVVPTVTAASQSGTYKSRAFRP
jgi:hypothetical protein